jgi:hypothetical protein
MLADKIAFGYASQGRFFDLNLLGILEYVDENIVSIRIVKINVL